MELELTAGMPELTGVAAEQDLIDRARHDRDAFAVLYRRHYQSIAGYIYRRVGSVHTTEDLTADVFIAALRTLGRYRHRGLPIKAWLYRIATNRVNRWARRERRKALARLTVDPISQDMPQTKAVLTSEFVRTALLTLPPKFQTVIALHHLEGMALADIAVALGCREGTIKSRLSRGREALRRRLEERKLQP